jgi:hypothetical protein
MNRFHPTILIVCVLLVSVSLPVCGDAAKTVEAYRASFEKRMNSELDGHGKKARELRQNYLGVLKKLKGELGRQEKLTAAAQVVAEIEAVEDGEQAKPIPENADYRFKRLRVQWERGIEEILRERNRKVEATSKLYLKALDSEKRKLTRAGKIKEALLLEEEEMRVKALPEVVAALKVDEPEEPAAVDLKKFLPGREFTYRREEAKNQEMRLRFQKQGLASLEKTINVKWEIVEERRVVLTHPAWHGTMHLKFAKDGLSFDGKAVPQGTWRRGDLIGEAPAP